MIDLFKGKTLETLFSKIEREFMNEVDQINENRLISVDVDSFSRQLTESHKIKVPTIEKEKTSSLIVKEKIRGEQLPSGTPFVPGRLIEIEVVDYKIPFHGDSKLFEYHPRNNSGWSTQADISHNHIFIRLTNWSTITGKDDEINKLREVAKSAILNIEDQLNSLREESKLFNDQLGIKIKTYLEKRVREVKTKFESNDKLRPF